MSRPPIRKIVAQEGYVWLEIATNIPFGRTIVLAPSDAPENYREITEEEAAAIEAANNPEGGL